jgi:hypothetical protein
VNKAKQLMTDYFAAINRNEWDTLAQNFFSQDVVFEGKSGKFSGRDKIHKWFLKIHPEGVKETMRINKMLIDGNEVACQIDNDFIFTKDLPDYFLGPAKKGEVKSQKIAPFYTVKDDKITHVMVFRFPSYNVGIST